MSRKDATQLQSGMQKIRANAKGAWQWLRSKPLRTALLAAGAVTAGAVAVLLVVGLPDWEVLDDLRDQVGAKPTVAELKARLKKDPKDASAHLELGHAQFESKNPIAAVRSYRRALQLEKSLASERVVQNLVSCFGQKCQSAAALLIAQQKLTEAADRLRPLVKDKRYRVRWGAINTLEQLKKVTRLDYLALWTTDLSSAECDVRRHAVEKLGKLGDRRAIDDLRRAKKKDAEDTPWYSPACLGSRAEEAEKAILASR